MGERPLAFLDLDGVAADCTGGVCTLLGVPHTASWLKPPRGPLSYDYSLQLGKPDVWDHVRDAGAEFWSGLQPYPWTAALTNFLFQRTSLHILTHPGRSSIAHYAAAGKILWCEKHLDILPNRVLVVAKKHLLAAPGRILIDDSNDQVDAWVEHGGSAIMVPQPWNRRHAEFTAMYANDTTGDYIGPMLTLLQHELGALLASSGQPCS